MQMTRSLSLYVAVTFSVCSLLIGREAQAAPPGRDQFLAAIEPPERPERFRNYDELSEYLEQLRLYHIITGRPRFGRSVDRAQAARQQWSSNEASSSRSRTIPGPAISKLWKETLAS